LFEFINMDAGHPQQGYERVVITASFTSLDFLNMPMGSTSSGNDPAQPPAVRFAIYAPNNCEPENYAGIGAGWPPYLSGSVPATIHRIDINQWQIDVNQPIQIVEWANTWVTYGTGKKQTTLCNGVSSAGYIWTQPVKFSRIWTRQ
jgi:hypothetical protein